MKYCKKTCNITKQLSDFSYFFSGLPLAVQLLKVFKHPSASPGHSPYFCSKFKRMADLEELEKLAAQIRRDIVRMVHGCQSGHPGGSLGCVEFFVALYAVIMNYRKDGFKMDGTGEDLFFLSNGHISPVWYSTLARHGFFSINELHTFRKIDS